ncbi:MAG: MFS transporter [Streptosporangiales bacterium]|nr:MFS transporter [Streptosporangiales bacterium]
MGVAGGVPAEPGGPSTRRTGQTFRRRPARVPYPPDPQAPDPQDGSGGDSGPGGQAPRWRPGQGGGPPIPPPPMWRPPPPPAGPPPHQQGPDDTTRGPLPPDEQPTTAQPPPGDERTERLDLNGQPGDEEEPPTEKRGRFARGAHKAVRLGGKGLHAGAVVTARLTKKAGVAADRKVTDMVGGPERKRVIVVLAGVLALAGADIGAIGAASQSLRTDFGLSNGQIGSLVSVVALAGGLATIPLGMLTDRINRVRMLAISVVLWGLGMLGCAFAPDYWSLLLIRVGLGVVVAVAGPAIASLAGDFFFPHERGKVLGFILAGEFIGTGIGYAVAGLVTAVFPWRAVFVVFAIPGLLLTIAVWRIREPKRGGQDRMEPVEPDGPKHRAKKREVDERSVHERVRDAGITPTRAALLDEDPAKVPIHRAIKYLLKIPSNVALVVSSALGYFFFAGLKLYATRFIGLQFDLANAVVSVIFPLLGVGAILGMLFGGRIGDWLVSKGKFSGRMVVGASGYLLVPLLLPIVLISQSFLLAFPVLILVSAGLAWPNPALDAARLDVVENRLWGRAESLRTVLKTGAEALAPWLFGFLVDVIGDAAGAEALGFRWTFAIMLLPLLASGIVLLRARKHYVGDVAAAALTEERFVDPERQQQAAGP